MQKKNAMCRGIAIETLDVDVDNQIVHGGPSTKRKQAPRTKVVTKTTKSKISTSKEEHKEYGELSVLKNWRDFDVEALIALRDEMEPNFVKNAKKQGNSLQFVNVLMLYVCKSP